MGYYAILSPAYTGHLNPFSVLGQELQRRGHRVVVIAPRDGETKMRRAGLEFLPIAEVEFPLGEWDRATARIGELTGLKASRFIGYWLGRFARGILRDLPAIVDRERFDGLIMDQVSIGTESVCQNLGLPMAVACNALSLHAERGVPPLPFSWRYRPSLPFHVRNMLGLLLAYSTGWPVTVEVVRFRIKNKLPGMRFYHMNELPPSLVQVAQQPGFFDFPRKHLPDHFHYTGPWKTQGADTDGDFPWDKLDGRPMIYASMGTLQNRLGHVFRIIAEACSGMDAQLVLALGRKHGGPSEDLPGNPIVVGYAPQQALLRRATMVITHGGLNTTLESLAEALPMVVVPVANDQPGVAARIAHLGLGEFIPVGKLTTAALRNNVRRVLTTPGYRERAVRFAAEIRRVNGPSMAAELIEAAFTSKQRIINKSRTQPVI